MKPKQTSSPFGELLRHYRLRYQRNGTQQALTQKELAERTKKKCGKGVGQSQISAYETGKDRSRRPPEAHVACLALTLGLNDAETEKLYAAAGYTRSADATHIQLAGPAVVRDALFTLTDASLWEVSDQLAASAIVTFAQTWELYAQAKKRQFNREWRETTRLCAEARKLLERTCANMLTYIEDAAGSSYFHLGEMDEAARHFNEREPHLDQVDPYVAGQILAHQGDVLWNSGHFDEAERKFRHAKRAFLNLQPEESRKKVLWVDKKYAILQITRAKWWDAIQLLEECRHNFEKYSLSYELIKVHLSLGWAYTQKGDWASALRVRSAGFRLAEAYRLPGGRKDRFLQMLAYTYFGLTLLKTGFLPEALERLKAAEDISKELEAYDEKSSILIGLAQVYEGLASEKDDVALRRLAARYSQQAIEACHEYDDSRRLARALIISSRRYLNPGEADRALAYLAQARTICRFLEHNYYLALIELQAAEAHLTRREDAEANRHILSGIKYAKADKVPARAQLAKLLALEARLLFKEGSFENAINNWVEAFAEAVLFNRFLCEYLAAEFKMQINESRKELARNLPQWPAAMRQRFWERVRAKVDGAQAGPHNYDQVLANDVRNWFGRMRRDRSVPRFEAKAREQIRSILEAKGEEESR